MKISAFSLNNPEGAKPVPEAMLLCFRDFYTESEQVYEFYLAVPPGITHSKQLSFRKPAKNEYIYF